MIDQRIELIATEVATEEVLSEIRLQVGTMAPHLLEMLAEVRRLGGAFPTFEHEGALYTVYDARLRETKGIRLKVHVRGHVLACEREVSAQRQAATSSTGQERCLLLLQPRPEGKSLYCGWDPDPDKLSSNEGRNIRQAPGPLLISFAEQCEAIFDQLTAASRERHSRAHSGVQALERLQASISYGSA